MQTLTPYVIHQADSRGRSDLGWLQGRHTFSFAEYRDPNRTRFGLLRVINDDVIQPSGGFGTHPHDNMEIVTVPLSGELRHEDSMGNVQYIRAGEVQAMSAGSGLTHSEFNASDTEPANLLQIWVFPKARDIEPRYSQKAFAPEARHNRLQNIVSPHADDEGVLINQDAWFWLGDFDAGEQLVYNRKRPENGIYLFVIEGGVTTSGEVLGNRDGFALADNRQLDVAINRDSKLLIMDVPL